MLISTRIFIWVSWPFFILLAQTRARYIQQNLLGIPVKAGSQLWGPSKPAAGTGLRRERKVKSQGARPCCSWSRLENGTSADTMKQICRFIEIIVPGAVPGAWAEKSQRVAFPLGAEGKGHTFRGKRKGEEVVRRCRKYNPSHRYERELRSLPLVNLTLSCVGKRYGQRFGEPQPGTPVRPARGSGSWAVPGGTSFLPIGPFRTFSPPLGPQHLGLSDCLQWRKLCLQLLGSLSAICN